MKIFKIVMRSSIILGLIFTIYLCGVYSAKYRQNQEENKSTITTIAVVNADTGAIVDGENVNYASELMSFPDTNFEVAGLVEAREGITSNRYAAYILIPSNFSESIESINGEPVKSQITYTLSDNLRQDVQIKVANDIHNFILNLSSNVSYVYVDAILKEMHAVQDDSKTIMANDIEDMESIEEVQNSDLIEEVEYAPLEVTETEIEYMDLSDDYETVDKTIDDIYDTYETDMEEAAAEFATIKEGGAAVDEQTAAAEEIFANVNILMDAEENCVYESGMENLSSLSETFTEEVNVGKFTAKERLGFKEGDAEPEPLPEPEEGEERYYISRDDLQAQVDLQMVFLNNLKSALYGQDDGIEEGENGEEEGGEGDSQETAGEEFTLSEEAIDNAITELENLKTNIDEYYQNGIRAINEIPDASEFAADADQIIHEEIEAPVTDEINAESENVSTALSTIQTSIQEYVTSLDEYDAMSYLETEKIGESMSSLYEVISNMEEEIMEQDNTYWEYIEEVNKVTDNNVQMLQDNLNAAYEQTQENIDFTLEGFKANRTDLNALNVLLLNGITEKLPYTRLGNLEYTQVYDFIVQPVTTNDISTIKNSISPTSVNIDKLDLICLFIGIMALIIIDIAVRLIHKRFKNKMKNGEEGEVWQME